MTTTTTEAFEAHYQRSAEDPASAEMLAIWEAAWNAATERAAKQEWLPIATAPRSLDCGVGRLKGVYLLGFCPDADVCNLESAICVVWWAPLMNKGKGVWYGEDGFEAHPTHWMPLPAAPNAAAIRASSGKGDCDA